MDVLVMVDNAVIVDNFGMADFDGKKLVIYRTDGTTWNYYVKLSDQGIARVILNSIYDQLSKGKNLDLERAFETGHSTYYGMQPFLRNGKFEISTNTGNDTQSFRGATINESLLPPSCRMCQYGLTLDDNGAIWHKCGYPDFDGGQGYPIVEFDGGIDDCCPLQRKGAEQNGFNK